MNRDIGDSPSHHGRSDPPKDKTFGSLFDGRGVGGDRGNQELKENEKNKRALARRSNHDLRPWYPGSGIDE